MQVAKERRESEKQRFDEEVDMFLENTTCGTVDSKIEAMASFIYMMGSERFGTKDYEARSLASTKENRRPAKLQHYVGCFVY